MLPIIYKSHLITLLLFFKINLPKPSIQWIISCIFRHYTIPTLILLLVDGFRLIFLIGCNVPRLLKSTWIFSINERYPRSMNFGLCPINHVHQ